MEKITEGIKTKGKRVEIPDTDRGDLPEFFKNRGYKVGVEVGVYKGDYTKQLASTGMKVYGIDPWKAYGDYGNNRSGFQMRQDELYEIAKRTVAQSPGVTLMRKTSLDALNDFKDGSLDFVYIDGHHGFRYVADDIWEWSKKIRKGGVIAGHDYGRMKYEKPPRDAQTMHVKYVVDAYTEACGIKDWYVLGRNNPHPGEKGDTWRSWFWIIE